MKVHCKITTLTSTCWSICVCVCVSALTVAASAAADADAAVVLKRSWLVNYGYCDQVLFALPVYHSARRKKTNCLLLFSSSKVLLSDLVECNST